MVNLYVNNNVVQATNNIADTTIINKTKPII